MNLMMGVEAIIRSIHMNLMMGVEAIIGCGGYDGGF
jgi:hypothetical protein